MKTFASLFSGGDLAGTGARMAGLTPIWGVEYDPDIAAIAELNGTKIIATKVEDVDFSALATPDWLHMSPPCINASVAKADAGEAPEDIEIAQGCIRAIHHFKSRSRDSVLFQLNQPSGNNDCTFRLSALLRSLDVSLRI